MHHLCPLLFTSCFSHEVREASECRPHSLLLLLTITIFTPYMYTVKLMKDLQVRQQVTRATPPSFWYFV